MIWATHEVEQLARENRHQLCRDAEAMLTVIDTAEFSSGRTFHCLEFADIGAPARGQLGFTCCQFHELAREHLPKRRASKPASAVAVNVAAVARGLRLARPAAEAEALRRLRSAVAGVAAHEYAHNIVSTVAGLRMPEGATLADIIGSLDGAATAPAHHRRSHCEKWLRAFIHLTARGSGNSCHPEEWLRALARDVEAARLGEIAGYVQALEAEVAGHDITDRLADIIRTPAPAGFLEAYHRQDGKRLAA
jgi:hypothetical protein